MTFRVKVRPKPLGLLRPLRGDLPVVCEIEVENI